MFNDLERFDFSCLSKRSMRKICAAFHSDFFSSGAPTGECNTSSTVEGAAYCRKSNMVVLFKCIMTGSSETSAGLSKFYWSN